MACNGLFGVGEGTMISPPSSSRYFDLSMAEIAVFDRECYQLILDLTMLIGMAQVSTRLLSVENIRYLKFQSMKLCE
jgi:hypothetical protein